MRRRSGKRSMPTTRSAPEQVCARNGELSDWSAAPDGDGVTRFDVTHIRPHIAGREDVGQKEHLLIRQSIRNLEGADIGEGHARLLGLPAEHVRVAEDPTGRMPKQLLGHPGIRVRVFTERKHLLLTEKTVATCDREG